MRACEGQYSVKTYEQLVINNIPLNGSVRIITLTDEQYKNMKVYIGKKINNNEEIYEKQLLLF
jgi:CRISPR-associated endonuclease Cas2